jgi:hypothetical protein
LEPTAKHDVTVTGRPVHQFGDPMEPALLIESRCLEVVGEGPDRFAATSDGFSDGGLQQASPVADASVVFVHP